MTRLPEMMLDLTNLVVCHALGNGRSLQAVAGVSLAVARGESLGLVGESGCGKSSLARAVMQCPPPTAGTVRFCGEDLASMDRGRLRALRPKFQMLFQDPASALNPRRNVGSSIALPLRLTGVKNRAGRKRRVQEIMAAVGLDPGARRLRPSQFSGGQCQRVQIARALVTAPLLLVCDEPVAALDVSIQAQILDLLEEMRAERGLTLIFISHDLAVVKNVCDRVAVMHLGKLCEVARCEDLYDRPAHPYTKALLGAVPGTGPKTSEAKAFRPVGEMPSPMDPPTGCRYRTRCPVAQGCCAEIEPSLREIGAQHSAACHLV